VAAAAAEAKANMTPMEKLKESAPFGYILDPLPESAQVIEKYWVREPFAGIAIAKMPEQGGSLQYFVQEVSLTPGEQKLLNKVISFVSVEINPAAIGKEDDIRKAVLKEARRILDKYSRRFVRLRNPETRDKIFYYLERDLLGYGPIHAIMADWRIEDISCDGVMAPMYVWHRRYESIPTNVKFVDKEMLDDFIVKLAHKSGKHVSSAFPIVDAMIFGKHRLAASFREEVSPKGSTFTIRKFREEPYSVVDLMNLGTINDEIGAYFWLMMENRASMLVIGGTAAGKTTLLNAIAGLIKPGYKVVTVEETAEINIPLDNWVQFTSRESYGMTGSKIGEVSLFDLVKTSLRYRPDFLVVGEVRGEEAFVLFQAVATGHGGLCTIQGESFDSAVKRLTSPPMNVAESYIPLMNVAVMLERVMLPKTVAGIPFGRRITTVWEVEDFNKYVPVFEWSPTEDLYYNYTKRSVMLHRFAYRTGRSFGDMLEEIQKRRALLRWLQGNNVRNVKEVFKYITEYYVDQKGLFRRLNIEVEAAKEIPTVEGAGAAAVEAGTPKMGDLNAPAAPAVPVAPPLKFLESGSFKILKSLSEANDPMEQVTLQQSTGLDANEFEKILGILTKIGHATTQQKSDKGGFKTMVTITPQGRKAYAQLSKKSSEL
jgi:flagellar protein FlaI